MSDVDLLGMYSRAAAGSVPAGSAAALRGTGRGRRSSGPSPKAGRCPPTHASTGRCRSSATAAASGCRIRRVHVVDLPLTAYLRYEMAAYRENIDAGEEVGIAVRSWHPDLAGLTEDFVLFDPGLEHPAMVWMRYDDQGQLADRAYSDNPADLARAARSREVALAHAVPLHEFVSLADTG